MAAAMGGGAEGAESMDFKSLLNTSITKRGGKSLTKGDVTYTVSADDVNGGPNGGFWATVSAPGMLQAEYRCDAPQPSKRKAEHAAAKAAIEAEFPQAAAEALASAFDPAQK